MSEIRSQKHLFFFFNTIGHLFSHRGPQQHQEISG